MKKLLLVMVLFVFVLSGVFAQDEEAAKAKFTIGGWVGASTTIIKGNSDSDIIQAGVNVGSQTNAPSLIGRINASGETADGKFGGFVRFDIRNFWPGQSGENYLNYGKSLARAWWKPNQYFKATLGNVDQGAVNYIVGWGFFANDMEDFMVTWSNPSAGDGGAWYGMGRGGEETWFVGPDNRLGLGLAITPITGLSINYFAPLLGTAGFDAGHIYKKSIGQIQYDIAGIGGISVAYWSGEGVKDNDSPDPGQIYASFNLTDVENFGLNIGAKYTLPVEDVKFDGTFNNNTGIFNGVKSGNYEKINSPVNIGLGIQYTFNDLFALKGRFAATFAGKYEKNNREEDVPFSFSAELCPVISGNDLKVLFPVGIALAGDDKNPETETLTWHFSPVLQKGIGPASVFAGVQLKDNGTLTGIEWAIPIGIIVGF